jgi:hypothetical protein
MGFILYLISIVLYVVLTPVNVVAVCIKYAKKNGLRNTINDYFLQTAIDIDKFGNHNFRTLLNYTLIKKDGYPFGRLDETISSVLGKNYILNKLSRTGKVIVNILNGLEPNHCIDAIID